MKHKVVDRECMKTPQLGREHFCDNWEFNSFTHEVPFEEAQAQEMDSVILADNAESLA